MGVGLKLNLKLVKNMEKIIVNHKRTKVVYDTDKKTYAKYFYPKFDKKLKYLLKIRKYPGENYKYISDILEKDGIEVAEIIYYDKYSIKTKEVNGKSLFEELKEADEVKGKELLNKYIELVSKIINLGIYFGDFNFDNFIVSNEKLYVIDLEDYRKDLFSSYRKKSLIKRLKRQLLERTELVGKMFKYYNGKDVFNEIENRLK